MIKKLKYDRETILMGQEAAVTGGLLKSPIENTCKFLPVTHWLSPEDSLTFEIESEKDEMCRAVCLLDGCGSRIRIRTGGQSLTDPSRAGWDRLDCGMLLLKMGRNTIQIDCPYPIGELSFYSLELIPVQLLPRLKEAASRLRSDTSWMKKAGYGLQFHWTTLSCPETGPRISYEAAVSAFDPAALAKTVSRTGAGYVIFTTSHAEHFIPAPITAVDRVLPGRTAKRDLIAELIAALHKYGIRLMLYYHIGHDDWSDPDGWWAHTGYSASPERFLANWKAIITEMGLRYRNGLAGWFFDDGCAYYPLNPDFYELTSAAKAGNPERVVCYNPWIMPRITDFQDYFCGEGYDFLTHRDELTEGGDGIFTDGPQKGLQAHTNFILETNWWHGGLNTPIAPPNVPLEKFLSDMLEARRYGIVPSVNLEIYQDGRISQESARYLDELIQVWDRA